MSIITAVSKTDDMTFPEAAKREKECTANNFSFVQDKQQFNIQYL